MLRFILYFLIFICSFNVSVHSKPRSSFSENIKSKIKSKLDDKENIQIKKNKPTMLEKNHFPDDDERKKIPSFYYDLYDLFVLKEENDYPESKNILENVLKEHLSVKDSFIISMLDIALKSSLDTSFEDTFFSVRTKRLLKYIPVSEIIRSITLGVFERLFLTVSALKKHYPDPVLHPDYQNKLLEPALIYAGLNPIAERSPE